MPGISYSRLSEQKNGPVRASDGISLGSRVHYYINEPHLYDGTDIHIVAPLAHKLLSIMGNAKTFSRGEQVVTCDMVCDGMKMSYKGKMDELLLDTIVDYKVISGADLPTFMERFGSHIQQVGYCLASGATRSIIIAVSRTHPKKDPMCAIISRGTRYWDEGIQFWSEAVKTNGYVI